ncbi:DUF349 domain-containing protein [Propionibacteriaceae bacterium G1746]|uniref:DUF349 domain-containing protein n=1 Tax=Aestuariimicrobium sp. G57 TaxID=3418485 RepID=UPI003C14AF39
MSETARPHDFGRVDPDGTVYVTTAEGERSVGQVPDVEPAEALEFYVRRFRSLETEVDLLATRVGSGAVNPDEARRTINTLRTSIAEANAVGDLAALATKLDALEPTLAAANEQKKAEKAAANARTKDAKEGMVAEAEKLAAGNDWRGGVNRFRALLEEWKALPRIDRTTDDELWHRFSSARTTYTRRRKAQFAQQNEARSGAQQVKQQIIEEARGLASSTDWGPTSGAFRDLMARWKAAGPAPRQVEDQLWTEFRAIQDTFFNARTAAQSEQDAEFAENLTAKLALLDEAEKQILPVNDLARARAQFRDFLASFNEHGKVPRDAIRSVDDRVRTIERAVKDAEDAEWKRTDPEARQRAQDTVDMFTAQIEKLEKQAAEAEKSGNQKKLREARNSIAACQSWLEQAKATLAEFSA